ncbi:MAG: hypothetical protein JXR52_13250, partial [Bacteroidales bacterium]|nr:hypothetical protein [Bacteroidales bacterium]
MNIKTKSIKVLFFLAGITMYASIYAQDNVPQGLRYQAIARDDRGSLLIQRDIVAKMQIVQMEKDILIWEELHYTTTNEFGLFYLVIGEGFNTGEGLVLDFESIHWEEGPVALQVYVDFGKGFLDMGFAELQSVPYAILSDSALKAPLPNMELGQLKNVSNKKPTKNQPLIWNGKEWLAGDSIKIKNLLILDEAIANQNVIVKGAIKIGDSGLILGVTSDSGLSDASDQTIPTSKAVKTYVDDLQNSGDNQALSFEGTSNILSLERGGYVNLSSLVNDADADPANEIQDLQMIANILSITGKSDPTEIDLAPYQGINTDNQELSLSGTLLEISGGNTVDLSPVQDGTEDADSNPSNELQSLSLSGTELSISNGNSVNLGNLPDEVNDADADPLNELQDISLSSTFLSISNGSTIDLSPVQDGYDPNTDEQNLFISGHQLSIENGNTVTLPDNVNDADADPANELQDISLSSTFLSITEGSTIDLSPIQDGYDPNTDNQNLILQDHLLTIVGGNSVTLPDNVEDADADPDNELQTLSISSNVLSISNGNSVTIPTGGTDADADPTNEIQDLQLVNNILTITDNSNATPIDLSPYQGTNTDNQELTLSGTSLSISGGNSVDLSSLPDEVNDADADPANELQDISLAGTNLSITSGSTVDLATIRD